jgi:hypothetical protein|tara:strand:+ start:458 stop:655 length:198 start_codon:yes stop_codon:yes gene_type:complete
MKAEENWGTKELFNFLSQSNEALRIENLRLMDEVERLTNNIEVHDAIIMSQEYNKANYYYSLKTN